jgi:divalent metal cation (Fe/Co/Zn/Cd) transporter
MGAVDDAAVALMRVPQPEVDHAAHDAAHDAALAHGRRLEIATIGWNVVEVFVTIGLGLAAASLALIAFGLDSLVEIFASVVVVWYIGNHHAERRAERALRLVALAFALLGVYLLVASIYNLRSGRVADSSPLGIAYLAIAASAMFVLAFKKQTLARRAHSKPLAAEARMTFLDGCLATSILVALVMNAAWSIWWADPAAALLVGLFCFREAFDNWLQSRADTVEQLA